ncbi:MAG: preprotein translocase subunit SecE [Candidatus Jorgensenbacteria bacterium]|nr:preprotein translocase subunit SecE [Candidatus Jorgensenbacteria bacterium]
MGRIQTFLEESRAELKKVSWPSREDTVRFTIFIIVFSFALGIFLGVLDFGFLKTLERVIMPY